MTLAKVGLTLVTHVAAEAEDSSPALRLPTVPTVTGFTFSYTVPNNGVAATSGSWTDSIFVSCSPTFNPATLQQDAPRYANEIVGRMQSNGLLSMR